MAFYLIIYLTQFKFELNFNFNIYLIIKLNYT